MNILKLFYKTKREMPLGWEPREARGLLAQVWSTGRLGSCCWDSYAHYTLLSIQLPEFSFQSVSSMMLHLCAKPLNGFLEIRVEIWQLVHKAIHDLKKLNGSMKTFQWIFRVNFLEVWLVSSPSRVFSNITVWKHQFLGARPSLWSNPHIHTWLLKKTSGTRKEYKWTYP